MARVLVQFLSSFNREQNKSIYPASLKSVYVSRYLMSVGTFLKCSYHLFFGSVFFTPELDE
jgi:hypothetical protein